MAYILDTASNLKTLVYTIGVDGVANCDYNFTSVANTTEQSIQLGGTTIIPIYSVPINMVAVCLDGLNGAITGTSDIGRTTGASEYLSNGNLDDTNDIRSTFNGGINSVAALVTASSVWFSFTPSANWNTVTNGTWKVYITYIDNSTL